MDGGNKNKDWMTTTIQRRLYLLNLHLAFYFMPVNSLENMYTQTIFEKL